MTEKEKELLSIFEARLRLLVQQHKKLKEDLITSQDLLEQKTKDYEELAKKLKEVEQSYNHLKTAKVISIYDTEVDETKNRLSWLVREVDKCINLLNE
ncbi:MAG: hypothetical protein PHQ88_00105 [Bacteroides sp.]|nr:hypothetical protein [Bacteroides sp.]MDD2645308.1 hypothetical protein [Bacteroides sp.]MDD4054396.1 hypothetical protein [Bacteroides sp.]MDD4719250.1 hypothetical protein [Bacteroides sp.]NLI63264.1 hypothetical protein [Bacteroidales bacterium]